MKKSGLMRKFLCGIVRIYSCLCKEDKLPLIKNHDVVCGKYTNMVHPELYTSKVPQTKSVRGAFKLLRRTIKDVFKRLMGKSYCQREEVCKCASRLMAKCQRVRCGKNKKKYYCSSQFYRKIVQRGISSNIRNNCHSDTNAIVV